MAEAAAVMPPANTKKRRQFWIVVLAFVVAITSIGIALALSRPTDVQAVQVHEPTLWLSRESAGMYGRLNVDIMELDSVQETTSAFPRWIVQDGDTTVLLGGNRYLQVDAAMPMDIDQDTVLSTLPATISQVRTAGHYVALRDEYDQVYATTVTALARGELGEPINIELDDRAVERLVAMSVDSNGQVIAVNSDGVLVTYQIPGGDSSDTTSGSDADARSTGDGGVEAERTELENVTIPVTANRVVTLTTFGQHWAALTQPSPEEPGSLWIDDQLVASDIAADAQLALPSRGEVLYVATGAGLNSYRADGTSGPDQVSVEPASAVAPIVTTNECAAAVWPAAGQLWASLCGEPATVLEGSDTTQLADRIEWRITADTVVVNNATRGTAWVLRDGAWEFVVSSAAWVPQESTTSEELEDNQEDTSDAMPPIPATGENAQFGVRPDAMTRIPVLIGATDPNRDDIISIIPGSLRWRGEDAPFPTPQLVDGNTAIVVDSTSVAEGEATLQFEITDGYDSPSHRVAAQVTVTVRGYDRPNEAPRMVLPGKTTRPLHTVAPGANIEVDVLRHWVDPEGDALLLTAQQPDEGSVVAQPNGRVVYRASDEAGTADVTVRYNVVDALGTVATEFVAIQVRDDAAPQVVDAAVTGVVNQTARIPIADYVSGATSMVRLGVLNDVPGLTLNELQAPAAIEVQAAAEGEYTIAYEVVSGAHTSEGTVRFTAISAKDAQVTVPPLAVYVAPGTDTQIDPLAAISNPGDETVAVTDVEVLPYDVAGQSDDSQITVDVATVEGSELRVFAETASGEVTDDAGDELPGRIAGSFRYNVVVLRAGENAQIIPGYGVVYLVPQDVGTAPITVADTVQVRAGATVDVDVLANDIAPAGSELVLDPRPRDDTTTIDLDNAGLAFASGSTVRILAPREPGIVEVPYYVYTRGNPVNTAQGRIYVLVNPPGGQGSPNVTALRGQMRRGGQTVIDLPRAGGDPDGDEILAVQTTQPDAAQVEVINNGRGLRVTSTEPLGAVEGGQPMARATTNVEFSVDVSDGDHTVTVPVSVAVTNEMPRPVAFNDYRYEPEGQEIRVQPLLNDSVPAGRNGRILDVFELRIIAGEITPVRVTTVADDGQSFIVPVGDGPTTYEYTLATGLAQDGIFDPVREIGVIEGTATARVIVASSDVSVPPYPRVTDTYVGASDIVGDTFNVDVYTNKVVWAGEPLTLSLVEPQADVETDARTHIAGKLAPSAQVLAFALRSTDQTDTGYPVVSYGFVHIPAAQFLRPELRDPNRVYTVTEGASESLTVNLAEAVVPLAGRQLEIDADARVDGRRSSANARCVVTGTTVTYYPGIGSTERSDGCTVTARWSGQADSEVALRIALSINLLNSPPEFLVPSIPFSVFPRETNRQLDLLPYISWQRASGSVDKRSLTIGCDASPSGDIVVQCSGASLTVVSVKHTAARQQVPISVWISGPEAFEPRVESVVVVQVQDGQISGPLTVPDIQTTIEFTGFGGSGSANQTVNVLEAIEATLDERYFGWMEGRVLPDSLSCGTQSRLPLSCGVVDSQRISIEVAPGSENSPTPSGTATISYRFVDTTTAGRQAHQGTGQIHVTYRSVPPRPTLSLESVTGSSVTFKVTAADTQPAISEVRISAPQLPPITRQISSGLTSRIEVPNLNVNDKYDFTAAVFNGVGWSAESAGVTAWAYEAPEPPAVKWAPVATNDGKGGRVQLWITAQGANTGGYRVLDASGNEIASNPAAGRTWNPILSSRSNSREQVSVVALAAEGDPISANKETARKNLQINGVAAPKIESLEQVGGSNTLRAKVSIVGDGSGYQYGWALGGASCALSSDVSTADSIQKTFDAITTNRQSTVKFCARAVASSMRDRADINLDALGGNFGGSHRDNNSVIVVGAPTQAEVTPKFQYEVTGDLQSGFNVPNIEAQIGQVRFVAIQIPGDPKPAWDDTPRRIRVYLKAVGRNFETSKDEPYWVGPKSGKPSYVPGELVDEGFPDFTSGCVAPDSTEFEFRRPTLTGVADNDWMWSYAVTAPGGHNHSWTYRSSESGATKIWQPLAAPAPDLIVPGEYRFSLTVSFRGALQGLTGSTTPYQASVTCVAADPPEEPEPDDPGDSDDLPDDPP